MNEYLIEADHITLAYGKNPVLRGVSLQVKKGSIYGFLGRNGSGKTTFIRLLAGLSTPDSGRLQVLHATPSSWSAETLSRVGYMADTQILPSYMRARALIDWTRSLYSSWDGEIVRRLVSRFNLDLGKRVCQLSLGQQRHLAFILALAPRPDLLILDEPAANLDVAVRRAFLDEMLALLRDENKTVFFSTHILSDVERVADHVGILAAGKMAASEPLDDLKESVREIRFFWDRPEAPPVETVSALSSRRGEGETLITTRLDENFNPARLAEKAGCQWEERPLNLEDLFLNLTHHEGESL